MKKILITLSLIFGLSLPQISLAHCPLCTIGAVAAAGGAAWLGVDTLVIGIFIGASTISMGWWLARVLKKKYVPLQSLLIILLSFGTIVFPVMSMFSEVQSVYLYWGGDYGSIFNRTYVFNLFLAGSLIGGVVVASGPFFSKLLTKMRKGKHLPFQGVALTLGLLIIVGVITQLLI